MRVYYAHAMPIYGKQEEKEQLSHLASYFPGVEIVNPAVFNGHPEKRKDTLAFCKRLIDDCNKLVFTRYRDVITSGVGEEVNYALGRDLSVLELTNGKFIPVTKPVVHQSFIETIRMYYGDKFAEKFIVKR